MNSQERWNPPYDYVAERTGPRVVIIDPGGTFLYVANWQSNNVSGFTINQETGELTATPGSPFSCGIHPRALTVHPSSRFVYVANWDSNTVSGFAIDSTTGRLSEILGSPFTTAITASSQWLIAL